MDQNLSTAIAAGIPTLAVIASFVRNESAIAGLTTRLTGLENSLNARITSLETAMNTRITSLETAMNTRITSLETTLNARITSLESRLDARIESLDRDLRDWAKITMQHNSDIARLKEKAGLAD
jgi:chromosome segregation ATPase